MSAKCSIAIAESDSMLAHAIGRIFEPPQFQVTVTQNDDRVFELMRPGKFEALLFGCPRPTRDVLDRMERIRNLLPQCAIVVMTSGTRPRISRDFASSIKVSIIEKPFTADALRQAFHESFTLLELSVPVCQPRDQTATEPDQQEEIASGEVFDQLFADLVCRQPLDPSVDAFDVVEAHLIRRALIHCQANQSHAARFLGITRNTLRKRIVKYQFENLLNDATDLNDRE